ncbi:MAG: hypothetical protein KC646_14180 [Candidatus Cloacimonetes bacterium]|nr:hypothetical protein [Candidatus Cloacimonadota bacterium]
MKNIFMILALFLGVSICFHQSTYAEEGVDTSTEVIETEDLNSNDEGLDESSDSGEVNGAASSSEVSAEEQKETAIKECNNMFENEGLTGNSVCKNVQTTAESQMIIQFYTHCKATNGGPGDACRENTGYGLKLNEDITKGALESKVFSDDIAFSSATGEPIDIMSYHADVFCSTVGAARCLELHSHYILKLMQGDQAGATALYNGQETTEQKYIKRQLDSAKEQEFFFEGKSGRTINFSKVCNDGGNVKQVLNNNFYIGEDSTSLHNSIDVGSNFIYACAANPSSCDSSKGGSASNYSDIYSSNLMADGCNDKFLDTEGDNYLMSDQAMNDIGFINAMNDADSIETMKEALEGLGDLTEAQKKYVFEKRMKLMAKTSILKQSTDITEGSLCQEAAQIGSLPMSKGGEVSDYCKEVYFLEYQKQHEDELDKMSQDAGTQLDEDSLLDKMAEKREEENEAIEDKESLDALATHQAYQEIAVYEIRNNPELIANSALAGPDGPIKMESGVLSVLEFSEEKYGPSENRKVDLENGIDIEVKDGNYLADVPQVGGPDSAGFSAFGFGGDKGSNGSSFGGSNGAGSNGSSNPSDYGGAVTMNTSLADHADFSFVPRTDNSSNVYSYQEDLLMRMDDYIAKTPQDKAQTNTKESGEGSFDDYFNELSIDFGVDPKKFVGWQRMENIDLEASKDCTQSPLTSGTESVNDDASDENVDICEDALTKLPEIKFDE